MGRLIKAKIDEIERLRKEGYTQKEAGERTQAHLRTVRRYDPLHRARLSKHPSLVDRLTALERAMGMSWDWIDLLYTTMLRSYGLTSPFDGERYPCPHCNGKLEYGENQYVDICRDCGHEILPPLFWCYCCLSQQEMNYIEETDEWIYRKCGAKRYIP